MSLKLLVYGATGAQGGPVVHQALEAGYQVRAVSRHPQKARSLKELGVEVVYGDIDDIESLIAASQGIDAVFFHMPIDCWPPKAYTYLDNVLKASKAANVNHLVFSTSGAISDTKTGVLFIDIKKKFVEQALSADLPVTVLVPTAYLDNFLAPFCYPGIKLRGELVWPYQHEHKISWISLEEHGRFALALLERPETAGQVIRVSGADVVTMAEVADAFGKVLGKEVKFRSEPLLKFFRRISPILGTVSAAALTHVFSYHKKKGTEILVVDEIEEISRQLGVTPSTMHDAVADIVKPRRVVPPPDAVAPVFKNPSVEDAIFYRGQLLNMFVEPKDTDHTICVWEGQCPRGLGPPVHVHTREHEAFYVTKGTAVMGIDDEVFEASKGSFVFLPANRPHWFAPTSDVLEMLGITIPVRDGNQLEWEGQAGMFRETGEPATCLDIPPYPDEPSDVDKLIRSARKHGIEVYEPNPLLFDASNFTVRARLRKMISKTRVKRL